MADLLGVSSNQWTASSLETLHESSDLAACPATHDMHETHDMHDLHDMHDTHDTYNTHDPNDAQDVSFTDKIDRAESIRFSSRFKTSATVGFQPTELRTTEYVTNRMKVIDDGPGLLCDDVINCTRATENVKLIISDANLFNSLERAEKFAEICVLNKSLAAKVKNLEATGPIQEGPSKELAAD
jgi:hypothetical protein